MSAISDIFYSYVNLTTKGIMGNGSNNSSYVGDLAVLWLAAKVYVIFLAYALCAAFVANYAHTILAFWPYLFFIVASIFLFMVGFKHIIR